METSYSPQADGEPDPGEVVWAWVAYEDDPSQGKDRPVLVIGRDRGGLLASSSPARTTTGTPRTRRARGATGWTSAAAPGTATSASSEVRLDRLLRMPESEVRREGAALDRGVFDAVVAAAREHHAL